MGYVDLIINNSRETTTVELPREATAYVLSGQTGLRSRVMCLNGQSLALSENDELPQLSGVTVPAGKTELPAGACAFYVI